MSVWRKFQWIIIFGTLSAFTLFTVGGMGVSYAQGYNGFITSNISHLPKGHMIYFADSQGRFDRQQYVCSISSTQLSSLESSYTVTTKVYNSKRHSYTIATVNITKGQSVQGIKQIVGRRLAKDCKAQTYHSVLYLFTVPQMS